MKQKDVSPSAYLAFSLFLEQQCGIVLGDNKQYLVRSRLAPLLYQFNFDRVDDLIQTAITNSNRSLLQAIIDAMTTNETLWFRDSYPFELFKQTMLPSLEKLNRPVRIWSAACSSGQEPYSIAMSVLEYQRQKPGALRFGAEVVATDLSSAMLGKCEAGIYDELSLARGLSPERRQRFFQAHEGGMMQVLPEVRRMVSFRSLNLLHSYTTMGRFDLVFCRNVLIYFAPDIKQRILQQIAAQLNPCGMLFLGASESIGAASNLFEMKKCPPGLYYQRKD